MWSKTDTEINGTAMLCDRGYKKSQTSVGSCILSSFKAGSDDASKQPRYRLLNLSCSLLMLSAEVGVEHEPASQHWLAEKFLSRESDASAPLTVISTG